MPYAAEELSTEVGGQKAIRLSYLAPSGNTPHFVSADLLPGRGMNIFQLRANLPGRGVTELILAPGLEEAAARMSGGPDDF
jgi:hypothetical protein